MADINISLQVEGVKGELLQAFGEQEKRCLSFTRPQYQSEIHLATRNRKQSQGLFFSHNKILRDGLLLDFI